MGRIDEAVKRRRIAVSSIQLQKINKQMENTNKKCTDEQCNQGHVCVSDCRRDGCVCDIEHEHEEDKKNKDLVLEAKRLAEDVD